MIDGEPIEINLKGDLLMGYKGDSYMDTGYFYAPYIPITQTPVVLDPNSFTPQKGILTRYGKKLLDKNLWGKVTVDNFKNDNSWIIKKKPKKIWRDITDPSEVSRFD
jgi:hypothetical protein